MYDYETLHSMLDQLAQARHPVKSKVSRILISDNRKMIEITFKESGKSIGKVAFDGNSGQVYRHNLPYATVDNIIDLLLDIMLQYSQPSLLS